MKSVLELSPPRINARFVMLLDPGTRMAASGGFSKGMMGSASGNERSFIGHAHQKQTTSGGRGSGFAAVAGFENLRDLAFRPITTADIHERAGDGSHHIVQETIGLHVQPNPLPEAIHGHMRDGSDAGHAIGPIGFEAAEIMPSVQTFGRSSHSGGI